MQKSTVSNIPTATLQQPKTLINAEHVEFKTTILSKSQDIPTKNLEQEIFRLIKTYKLTSEELIAYLAEKDEIDTPETDIANALEGLKQAHSIKVIELDTELLLKPIFTNISEDEEWNKINRENSKKWIHNNTILDSFYKEKRLPYTDTIKALNLLGGNFYNRICNPTDNPMELEINGKKFSFFTSNDYLGLSRHPLVIDECIKAVYKYGNGTGGARILSGTTSAHRSLEKKIAEFKGCEDSVVLNCGYMTNLALMSLVSKETVILFDQLDHASIIDGIRLSGCEAYRFKHNNLIDLQRKLKKIPKGKNILIVIEGVYSMEGDICPLPQILDLANQFNAKIAIDEAHSIGVIGQTGRGVLEYFNISPKSIDFKMGTLSKAIGGEGGYIAGNKKIIELIKYTSRQHIFSTSLPASTLAGAQKSFEIIENNSELATALHNKSVYLREELLKMNFNTGNSQTQIIPIFIEDEDKVQALQLKLEQAGILVHIARHPVVPPKRARLRISVSAVHTERQLNMLLGNLKQYGKELGVI